MSQQLTVTAKDKIKDVMGMLEARKDQFRDLLPKYLTPEKMFRVAQTAIAKSPQLLSCTPASLVLALMDAAQAGLEVNGRDAALVPYGTQCQFQPMFHGMVKQAITEGVAKKIQARLVYENDEFDLWYDPEPHIKHIPAMVDEGEIIGAYTYAIMPDGEMVIEFMNKRKLDHIKAKAKSRSGPWSTDEEEMYRKTPTKRLFKYLPIPDRLEFAVTIDNMLESGQPRVEMPLLDMPPAELQEPKQTATQKLAEKTRKTRSDKGQSRKETSQDDSEPPQPDSQAASEEPNAGNDPPILGGIQVPARCKEVYDEIMVLCRELQLNSESMAGEYSEDKTKNLKLLTLPEGEKLLSYLIDLKAKRQEEIN